MSEYGKILEKSRVNKGLSLEEISRELKINLNMLKKLELSDSKSLPNATVTKGFIRSFCGVVGLDSKPVIDQYMASLNEGGEDSSSQDTLLKGPDATQPFYMSEFIKKKMIPVLALLVFSVLGYLSFKVLVGVESSEDTSLIAKQSVPVQKENPAPVEKNLQQEQEVKKNDQPAKSEEIKVVAEPEVKAAEPEKKEAVAEKETPEVEKTPVVTEVAESLKAEGEVSGVEHKLVVEPLAETYLYIKADADKEPIRVFLKPDKIRTFKFKKAEIRFLDSGAINIIFNDEEMGPPGVFAEDKTIEFPSLKGL